MTPLAGTTGRWSVERRRSVLLVWAVTLAGCGAAGPDPDRVRAELEAVTDVWEASLLAGTPAAAVPEVFTEDAVRLPVGAAPTRGRAAIAAALAGSAALEHVSFELEDVEVDDRLAFANGVYEVRPPGAATLTGKFLEVWKRTDAGWRIHRVMWDGP